jgi:DegV family protein with EDD domain
MMTSVMLWSISRDDDGLLKGREALIRIVTDSTCDLPHEVVKELGITVVPLYIRFNAKSYREGLDLSWREFYEKIESEPQLPTTSQPSPGDFYNVFEGIIENNDSIISIHISTRLSGTYNSALTARGMLLEEYEDATIDVMDSLSASLGLGVMVITAAEMARQGVSHQEIVDMLKTASSQSRGLLMVNSLDHLYRGGRMSRSQAFLGNLMNIIPLLQLEKGAVSPLDKAMGTKGAIRKILVLMKEKTRESPPHFISIIMGTKETEGEEIYRLVEEAYPGVRKYKGNLGAVIGTHAGISAVAILWF